MASSPSSLTPRPSPPSEAASSRALRPIYAALDSRQFSKALKLATSPPGGDPDAAGWDVVRALRAHALERVGRRGEALRLVWDVVAKDVVLPDDDDGGAWSELRDAIQRLTDVADLVEGKLRGSGPDVMPLDPVRRLDLAGYAPIPAPSTPSAPGAGGTSAAPPPPSSSGGKASKKGKGKGGKGKKGGGGGGSGAAAPSSAASSKPRRHPPVTDDTVLQTLCVTLKAEGLYDAMSEMYLRAGEALADRKGGNGEQREEQASVVEEAVGAHMKAVCDCPDVGSFRDADDDGEGSSQADRLRAQLPRLRVLLDATRYHDRLTTSSLQLAKLTSQPLHFQWTAMSGLWHRESLEELVATLEGIRPLLDDDDDAAAGDDGAAALLKDRFLLLTGFSSASDLPAECDKLRRKMALLPRLAESLSARAASRPDDGGGGGDAEEASESDTDAHLATLLVQDKKEEALAVLARIRGAPMVGGDSGATADTTHGDRGAPRIDDENTILDRVGSILPYPRRKKLERMAELCAELGRRDEAEGHYRELLRAYPDQWSYWLGLAEVCARKGGAPSSSESPTVAEHDEEGLERCRSYAKEIAAANEGRKHPLRGPRLILLELASMEIRGTRGTRATSLRDEICGYGDKFCPAASCCFADVRPYLDRLVETAPTPMTDDEESGDAPDDVAPDVTDILDWARGLWTKSQLSIDIGDEASRGEADEPGDRRKTLRTYIFAVQVVYAVAAHYEQSTLPLLERHAPTTEQLAEEWRTSLATLPSASTEGQKEVLPGDDLVLLASQRLEFEAAMQESSPESGSASATAATPYLLRAAALLEEAMDRSPYNPHLKIAAVGVYAELRAARRALSIYRDLGIKQIQLDSCSYLILDVLVEGGLYTDAVKLSSEVLRLHGSTSKDVKEYAFRTLKNGLLAKAKEMVDFQRKGMNTSLQLLRAKALVMDAAPLMLPADMIAGDLAGTRGKAPPAKFGAEKGLRGGDDDATRAEEIARDAEGRFNAPSILHVAARCASVGDAAISDNRDATINDYQILRRARRPAKEEVVAESLRQGHLHGLQVRTALAADAAAPPKKGKVPKLTEEAAYRCRSLSWSAERAREFGRRTAEEATDGGADRALYDACCALCEAVPAVVRGRTDDALSSREAAAVAILEEARDLVRSARASFGSSSSSCAGVEACLLLPRRIAPLCVLLRTIERLFALFGWGKRKRSTRPAAGALADLALTFRDLVSELLKATEGFRSFGGDAEGGESLEKLAERSVGAEAGEDVIRRVVREVASSRETTRDRVDPFLAEMRDHLATFDEKL